LSELQAQAVGIVISGDLNIHHARWLRYSNANTPVGVQLKQICDDAGMQQIVREPTRNQYLLDLCISDLEHAKVEVKPKIADHMALLSSIRCPPAKHQITERKLWHFKGAAWQNLRCDLAKFDWRKLNSGTVDQAVDLFIEVLTLSCETFIPQSVVQIHKQSHPWLNDHCAQAIAAKNAAEESSSFQAARDHCAKVIAEEHREYKKQLREKLASFRGVASNGGKLSGSFILIKPVSLLFRL
jgi:hypothetical protein